MRKIAIILTLFCLSACDHFEQDKKDVTEQVNKDAKQVESNVTSKTMRVADNVRDSIKRTGERMREWWITPLPSTAKQPMPARYCYHVLQDILCYRDQMPGWEDRLVAYQGDNAVPPTPATMKLMPLREDDHKSSTPEKKVANMKPVFVAMPPEVKEEKKQDPNVPVAVDPAYEPIQDSVSSPQL